MSKIKILALPALLLFVAAACNNNNSQKQQTQLPNQPELQTFRYQPDGFEFQYPVNLSFTAPQYTDLEQKIAQIDLPKTDYQGTNFADAGFAVSSQFAPSAAACVNLPSLALELRQPFDINKTVMINGLNFYSATGNGDAAGNIYETHAYRIWHNQSCIELTETLHTGNISNYPEGTVKEVDHNQIFNRLDQVLNSFKFD